MKTIIKLTILLILYGYINLNIFGQNITRHEFSIGIGGGLSTLNYSPSSGDSKKGIGGGISLGYTHFLTKELGLVSGLEYSLYKARVENAGLTGILTNLTDLSDQETFDFKSEISKYEEKQTASYLNIPLMVQYQRGQKNKFYLTAGVKIGIPISGSYKSKGDFVNQGFFHESGIWTSTPEFMGFGDYLNKEVKSDMDFKLAYIASIEIGLKFSLTENKAIHIGVYFDYGLNNIVNTKNNFIKYNLANNKAEFSNNSILSSYTNENIKITDKVIPMAVGLKIKYAFSK